MKIRVELDVDPSEFQVAQELIATFRTITEHVRITQRNGAATASTSTAQAMPPPLSVVPVAATAAALPEQVAVPSVSKQPPAAVPTPQASPPPVVQPQPAAVPGMPNGLPAASAFKSWFAVITREDESGDESARNEAMGLILKGLPSQLESEESWAGFNQFLAAFEEALWKTGPSTASHVVPLCYIIPQLPDAVKEEAKKQLVNKVMKHLMIKRPTNTSRDDFFAHATTFAAMVQLDLVLVPGAVQTIASLLRKEHTCCAAITMLGKTVELCYAQLQEQCEPEMLEKLQAALDAVSSQDFHYDKEYIQSTMGWDQNAPAPQAPHESAFSVPGRTESVATTATVPVASVSQSGRLLKLEPFTSWTDFGSPVKGLAVDATRGQIISLTMNSIVSIHSFDGRKLYRLEPQEHGYTLADMDFNHNTGLLVLAGTSAQNEPEIVKYQAEAGCLRHTGAAKVQRTDVRLTHVRFLANSEKVVAAGAGNVTDSSGHPSTVLEVIEMANLTAPPSERPIYELGTQGMMTSLTAMPTMSRAFLTAHKTGVVYLWDTNNCAAPVATMLPPHYGESPAGGNLGVVTCLEILGRLVLAGAFGQGVNVWDLRELQGGSKELRCCETIKITGNGTVTRLARGPGERQAVVAAVDSIHTIQLNEDGSLANHVEGQKASEKFYYEAKWSLTGTSPRLYTASAGSSLDVYNAV